MKFDAKWTALSLAAMTTLGAAAFGGCTFSSDTDNDTDGGTRPPSEAGTSETDSGAPVVCEGNLQVGVIVSEDCQQCLNASCCTELKGCFNIDGEDAGGGIGCTEYHECIIDCNDRPEEERDGCFSACDGAAADGVQSAYETLQTCGATSCTQCGFVAP